MECEGAVTLWEKSIEKHNLRYRWMVSDGDSKAHTAVEDVYGGQCTVEKLDCVGHVQKRRGKHLMKRKATNKSKLSDGNTMGEEGVSPKARSSSFKSTMVLLFDKILQQNQILPKLRLMLQPTI